MAIEFYALELDTDDKQMWLDWAGHAILTRVFSDEGVPVEEWEWGDPISLGRPDGPVLGFDVSRLTRQGLGLADDGASISWEPFPGTYVYGGSGGFQQAYAWLVRVERATD